MDELIKLPVYSGDKASWPRSNYDRISVNICGLESIGIKVEQHGSLLIPAIMSKRPLDVYLQKARVTTWDVWSDKTREFNKSGQ